MRTARLVGLSQDGQSLVLSIETATGDQEELTIAVDERLRAALRGDRPRLGQLEIEMENSLSPRDIQSRIRAGETLDNVARVAGMPLDRVERFAAPVIAEREHIATTAMGASVRRRGDVGGHRSLRLVLTERLLERGVDIDTLRWDSRRLEDGRWAISADYELGDAERQAIFLYDLQARFSVSGNDDARWVLGENSGARGSARRRPAQTEHDDTEPTLDLSDELALVQAVAEPGQDVRPPAGLHLVTDRSPAVEDWDDDYNIEPQVDDEYHLEPDEPLQPLELLESDEPTEDEGPELEEVELDEDELEDLDPSEQSQIEAFYAMLGGDGYAEESTQVYAGLSDATAVPETPEGGWEPAIVVNYPVEPSLLDEFDDDSSLAEPTLYTGQRLPGTDEPGPPTTIVEGSGRDEEAEELRHPHPAATPIAEPIQEPLVDLHDLEPVAPRTPVEPVEEVEAPVAAPAAPARPARTAKPAAKPNADATEPEQAAVEPEPAKPKPKPKAKKRASVPSWDEIMFGGPKRD